MDGGADWITGAPSSFIDVTNVDIETYWITDIKGFQKSFKLIKVWNLELPYLEYVMNKYLDYRIRKQYVYLSLNFSVTLCSEPCLYTDITK